MPDSPNVAWWWLTPAERDHVPSALESHALVQALSYRLCPTLLVALVFRPSVGDGRPILTDRCERISTVTVRALTVG